MIETFAKLLIYVLLTRIDYCYKIPSRGGAEYAEEKKV